MVIIADEINHRISDNFYTGCYWFSRQVILMNYGGSIELTSFRAVYDVICVMQT